MATFFIFFILILVFIIITSTRKLYTSSEITGENENEFVKDLESQLSEVTNEFKNKQINEEEHKAAKFEINKRILKEIRTEKNRKKAGKAPLIFSNIFLLLGIPFLILLTSTIYIKIGHYGFKDQPQKKRYIKNDISFVNRLNQQQAELLIEQTFNQDSTSQIKTEPQQLKVLVDRLKIILKDRPKDLKGYNLLVDNTAKLGDYKTSYQGQNHIIENIKPKVSAEDYSKLAELMISATNGYVSIEAEDNIKKSLHLDSSNHRSRYYYGLLKIQKKKFLEGYNIWKDILAEGIENSPWNQLIKQDIKKLEKMINGTFPEEPKEPWQINVNEETMGIINEMVLTLSKRLKTEGGTYEEWIKLIRSYLVLGKKDKANEAIQKAIHYFIDQPDILKKFRDLELKTRK